MINVLLRVETERKRSCILVHVEALVQICEPDKADLTSILRLYDVQFFQSNQ